MADQYSETTRQGYGSRIASSFSGILFGLLFFFGSFALLWWNEGNLARERVAFQEMTEQVVEGDANKLDPVLVGKLVHLSADLVAPGPLADPEFLTSDNYLVLERQVEMYQWVEEERSETTERAGGSSETTKTYTYSREWKRGRVDSSDFKHRSGHENPYPQYEGQIYRAMGAKYGVFSGHAIVERLSAVEPLILKPPMIVNPQAELRENYLYISKVKGGGGTPELGDLRISFRVTRPGIFSVVAVQKEARGESGELAPFIASNGKEKFLVESGEKTAAALIASARDAAGFLAWILRGVGAFLMWLGLVVMLNPLATLLSLLPPLAKIGRGAIALFAFVLTLILSTLTILMAMIAYSPLLLGSVMLLGIVGIVWWLKGRGKAAAVPPPPPAKSGRAQ